MARNTPVCSVPHYYNYSGVCGNPPKEDCAFLENNIYFTLQWEINLGAVIQHSSEVVVIDRESWLLSAMSKNQSRVVQSNL